MVDDWEFLPPNDDIIWARRDDGDSHGVTQEVLLYRASKELTVRLHGNDRFQTHVVAQVGAPIEVIAQVLRMAGWTVTPPDKDDL